MKQLAFLFVALFTLTATAQINYPYNPDENADSYISIPDLMEFLMVCSIFLVSRIHYSDSLNQLSFLRSDCSH